MADDVLIRHNFSNIDDLSAQLRLHAACGPARLTLDSATAIALAHRIDQGRLAAATVADANAVVADAKALHQASQEAIEAAGAAMAAITAATESLRRLVVGTTLRGAFMGALTAVAVLDQLGLIAW